MRTIIRPLISALAVAIFVAGVVPAFAEGGKKDADPSKSVSIEGTLIDTKCYAEDNNNTGNDHGGMKGCGTTCARMGIPVGILVGGQKGGTVLILLAPSKALAEYIGVSARVTGTKPIGEGTLLPDKVEVKAKDGTFKQVDLTSMM